MKKARIATEIIVGGGALVLAIVAVAFYLNIFSPKPYPQKVASFDAYDPTAMVLALTPAGVKPFVDTITSFGSRFVGQTGYYKTQAYIRQNYQSAGLEIQEFHSQSVAPQTQCRQVFSESGVLLSDIDIYPFMPNQLQPMVTPDSGLTGRLVLITDSLIQSACSFDGFIGVIDTPSVEYKYNWIQYAKFGFKALIVTSATGLDGINWDDIANGGLGSTMFSSVPVNYIRLAAGKNILNHLGQTVTLKVKTSYQQVGNVAFIGKLKAANPVKEALVFSVGYDAFGILPDSAPGGVQSVTIATHLALLKGMVPYEATLQRDVYFVAHGATMMANYGLYRILKEIGTPYNKAMRKSELAAELRENNEKITLLKSILPLFDTDSFFVSPAITGRLTSSLSAGAVTFMSSQVKFALNQKILEKSEKKLAAKVEFERDTIQSIHSPEFARYSAAKREYDNVLAASGYPLNLLLSDKADFVRTSGLKTAVLARFKELQLFHERRKIEIADAVAVNNLFYDYSRVAAVDPQIVPSPVQSPGALEQVTYSFSGNKIMCTVSGSVVNNLIVSEMQKSGLDSRVKFIPIETQMHEWSVVAPVANIYNPINPWINSGHFGMLLVNIDRKQAYNSYSYPVLLPFMQDLGTCAGSLDFVGRFALTLAHGNGHFALTAKPEINNLLGSVFIADVGSSLVPSFPAKNVIVGCKSEQLSLAEAKKTFEQPGHFRQTLISTDVYGRYDMRYATIDFVSPSDLTGYSPEAAKYGSDGVIRYFKDNGPISQSIYASKGLNIGSISNLPVNLVLYRGDPVALLDLVNPQTMKNYTGWEFIEAQGMSAFDRTNIFTNDGIVLTFIPPEKRFFIALKAGLPGNELLAEIRAFMLAAKPGDTLGKNNSIPGRGYLASDRPLLTNISFEVARSMNVLNTSRLALQNKYRMADDQLNQFQGKAKTLLDDALAPGIANVVAVNMAKNSVTYSILNHPVIRENIHEAVLGILWYLALLVPFVFFFEKLVFGFNDIRKQLAVQATAFVVVFALLNLLHPAFQMIRSSLMILLGFVIFLISVGITFLFAGKFQENLEEMRKKQGKVSGAEVDTFGVMGTAFLLGLNNMHKRKVRTGLTCGTLILITVVMICFTSLSSSVVDTSIAIGKAGYQGFLIKRAKMYPISDDELLTLNNKYGTQYTVLARKMYCGVYDGYYKRQQNPLIKVLFEAPQKNSTSTNAVSVLQLSYKEPLQGKLQMMTTPRWFTREDEIATSGITPVFIPDVMAASLGITVEMVNASPDTRVLINGSPFSVKGIFNAQSLSALTDLDNKSILPYDIEAMSSIEILNGKVIAKDDAASIPPENILIAPLRSLDRVVTIGTPLLGNVVPMISSVTVVLDSLPYKQAKEVINQYLEQSQESTNYGVDGTAYIGMRARQRSMAGFIDLLIPLIIAALTVLNTMRGSVYERRDEIYVYNAVGIAPRFIAFMFFAEAFVYSVVGAVLGYLLSQGLGRILTELHMTGGLNMTFTSAMSIYASVVIAISVFVSTYFPARTAMEIAAPAEDSGWTLPKPDGDILSFDLPFTFNYKERIAVLAFFNRYFLDNGDGSAGKFFAGIPSFGISDLRDHLAGDAYIPQLSLTIWLRPFDLGVSQELTILLPTDPETGEYKAHVVLKRFSGTLDAWYRLNAFFVSLIRRHFLIWRAVPLADRTEMFEESRKLLTAAVNPVENQASNEVVHNV